MKELKNFVFDIVAKLEYVDYAACIALWALGAVLTVTGMPWLTIGIFALHLFETITIGIPV